MNTEHFRERAESLARRVRSAYLSEGVAGVVRRSRIWYHRKRSGGRGPRLPTEPVADPRTWPMSVLCVAERSLPQCYHYRVEQKREILRGLDIPFVDVDQHDVDEILSQLQLARLLLIYRLPDSPALQKVRDEARRLGIPVVYDVDDLVYRPEVTAANPNLDTLPRSLRSAVINGSRGYAAALRSAEVNLASTSALAADMSSVNSRPGFVVDNGIDERMLGIAAELERDASAVPPEGTVVITYGSGSRAHDHDFAVAAPGLARWLRETPHGRLRIIGPVRIPAELAGLGAQIEHIGQTLDYPQYLRVLRSSTITLAPLADEPFNRYKSQVKYLEAAVVGVPLIASPTVYAEYVVDGQTGLIANDDQQWYAGIEALAADEQLRRRIAESAREHVRRWELPQEPAEQMLTMLSGVCGWAPRP